ncbi:MULTISPECIES: 16S rRNA (guanine(966)-N(2))-methyltransferase RsmD [Prochlorococcus]|uniref:16S rRNA (guanine(966)-N(2))-methyltransferase RsmD n=1 Tax=Prochlorococcus TaxID=1218 RepID=UPI000533B239|nr:MULTISPECIES: 16S rRNA (guanine(966)-N(2))-methyltransferase RsmD [Prochlorococcus]KGG12217.1 Ribosomal RNA small subunit methyltransferase D [Prochlorococcus sp. MIT 0601]
MKLISGLKIKSPSFNGTRPTTSLVREAVMNIIGRKVLNSNWLDLCSGSGVMGCEALQKGASIVIAVEINRLVSKVCKENLKHVSQIISREKSFELINDDVVKWLKKGYEHQEKRYLSHIDKANRKFDLVYFDPPYQSNIYSPVLKNLIDGNWLKKDSLVICECANELSIDNLSKWKIADRRTYGKTSLIFLTPNQVEDFHVDTDSMH